MPTLSNDLIRDESMRQFLTVMGINLTHLQLSSIEGLYGFSFENLSNSETFASEIVHLLRKEEGQELPPIKTISLSTIIEHEISQAICNSEIDRQSCCAIFEIIKSLKTEFSFSKESLAIEIALPNKAYVPLLNLLKYSHMTFAENGKLMINTQAYLKNAGEDLIKIEGLNKEQAPLIFLNSSALESKKMFYTTKPIDDARIEVTPYFFVPTSTEPPKYHFVLDLSGSMENILPQLKNSVIQLAEQLFAFQPNAELTITTFSMGTHHLGTYTQQRISHLKQDINQLIVRIDTPLYEVTAQFIEKIKASPDHHNILLFTDGVEGGSSPGSDAKISELIAPLVDTPLTNVVARNKFYIFSYNAQQSALMQQVASVFQSPIINTSSTDFLAAQHDPQLMKEWAAKRELFTSRVMVTDRLGETTESTYLMPLNRSGQLASLPPRVCQLGETIQIKISDGSGVGVVIDTKTFSAHQQDALPEQGMLAGRLTAFGLYRPQTPLATPVAGTSSQSGHHNSPPVVSS